MLISLLYTYTINQYKCGLIQASATTAIILYFYHIHNIVLRPILMPYFYIIPLHYTPNIMSQY